jgi:uncharacterized membrane protein YphA (DoxX/SURF4 family)
MELKQAPPGLGRHVFGLAALGFGLLALTWRQFNDWEQIRPLAFLPQSEILLYVTGAIQIAGGVLIQFRSTSRAGAAALAVVYLFFALLWLPLYLTHTLVYDQLANFFEQFSLVSGALIVYGLRRFGYYGFGICVVSFTLEQLFYLTGTAQFVPKWIPPSQMFWAVFTTIAFALAAIALLSGRLALVASRLLVAMIAGFQILVWIPAPFASPHMLTAWAGNAENLAILGSAWIVADYLNQKRTAA